ncbi:MAG: hypothetical protein V1702_01510 [Candidatus Woesearchaeota archaeon]
MITMPDNKKGRKVILTAIRESVAKAPKTMYELSKELKSNWDTIKQNVQLLMDLGIVAMQDQKVIFSEHKQLNSDTIAGIPVSDASKKIVYALAKKFSTAWKEKTDKPLNNTILQKGLVEIADTFPQLGIPRGWYLYGRVVLVKVAREKLAEEGHVYDFSSDTKKIDMKILEIVNAFSAKTTKEIVDCQYAKHDQQMYQMRKNIETLLLSPNFKEIQNQLAKSLYELVFLFKLEKNDDLNAEVFGVMKDVVTLMITKIYENRPGDLLRAELISTFNSLWNLMANYYLYKTYEGNIGYDHAVIKSFFQDKISYCESGLLDQFSGSECLRL